MGPGVGEGKGEGMMENLAQSSCRYIRHTWPLVGVFRSDMPVPDRELIEDLSIREFEQIEEAREIILRETWLMR